MKIVWSCGLDASGYSSCAKSYIKALSSKCDVSVYVNSVAREINFKGMSPEDLVFFSKISTDQVSSGHFVQHCVPDRFIMGARNKFLYTVTESNIPKRWVKICNQIELIMTASYFCKQTMIDSGIDESRIKVIPHCHDVELWNDRVKPIRIGNKKGFNFLFMGDYTPRKNGDMTIRAFIRAFAGNKEVSLTIKSYFNSFSIADQEMLRKRIVKVGESTGIDKSIWPAIYFYGEPISEKNMPRFMISFDCLVSPHRGEGWGLALSEMMALGKPVISTRYSGNLDFMNDENSYLLDVHGFEPISEEMMSINPNYEGQSWPILDERELIGMLINVYEKPKEAGEKGKQAMKDVHRFCNFDSVSSKIIEEISKYD